ncbi:MULTISPECIES: DUF5074 domain-containing protein [unclassified Carboxylicivirga]|uniref:DUF5074 domain-containing protein n=1 Tax=Carboxylicivirga TaxID=1628153 RepID=UPI003D348CAA
MHKKLFQGLLITLLGFVAVSCNNDDTPAPVSFSITSTIDETSPITLLCGETITLQYEAANTQSISFENAPAGWQTTVDEETQTIQITAAEATVEAQGGAFTLNIMADGDSNPITEQLSLYWLKSFDDARGTFVLNEGNMTSENGSLIYITPEGIVIDSVYKRVNGTELGNVAQDMVSRDGKIYIISQNGNENPAGTTFENDGMLIILNAQTLKKEKAFTKEQLPELTWPSHIAVLDAQHVYIRDNGTASGDAGNGQIWLLNSESGELTVVEGSSGAPKKPFVTMDGKIYTFKSGFVYSYVWEISPEAAVVNRIKLPAYWKGAEGIQAAGNGQLWVHGTQYGPDLFVKYDLATQEEVLRKTILNKPANGSSGRSFVAQGNNIYYTWEGTICRLSFDEGAPENEEELLDISTLDSNAREFYNGLGVHPVTGHIYANTIKGVGPFYTTNHIWIFDFEQSTTEALHQFKDFTHFPAGIFFPEH